MSRFRLKGEQLQKIVYFEDVSVVKQYQNVILEIGFNNLIS